MSLNLSEPAAERLRAAGVDLNLLGALADQQRTLVNVDDDAFFAIAYSRGQEVPYLWAADGDAEPAPWMTEGAATWWPLGREGSTAVVVVGAEAGLALASILFHLAPDDAIRRRPSLPGVLASVVPVVLPETYPEIALEWVLEEDAPDQLVAELADAGQDLVFLALAVETPADCPVTEGQIRAFVDACAFAGSAAGLTVAPVLLASGVGLLDSIDHFRGHGRQYALAGILEFWHQIALNPPPWVEGSP